MRRDRQAADPWSDSEVLAAALFFTARGESELKAGGASSLWFDLARELVGSVAAAARRRSLQRDWTLALAALHNASYDGTRSRELLDSAAKSLADEPELLFAAARLHEAIAARAYSGLAEVVSSATRDAVQPDLAAALRLYERVLELVPDRGEARLRRGRVLSLLQRIRAARQELESLRAAPGATDVACLAALFLGVVCEQEGRTRDALAAYRSALATGRSPQVARLAIARVLRRGGDTGEARRVVDEMLADSVAAGDAWWRYQSEGFGDENDHAARFAALWKEARQ